jgi:WD40 repeat protein
MSRKTCRVISIIVLMMIPALCAPEKPKPPPPPPVPADALMLKLGDPLSPRALVTRPSILKGVVSWGIETRRHRGSFSAMVLSPDGSRLATGGLDGTVRIWDVESGKLLRALVGHGSYCWGLDWSPDGSMLASGGSFDATVRIWDSKTGYPLKVLKGHPNYVAQVAWAPDGRSILGAGGQSGAVTHWEVATGRILGKFDLGRPVLSVSWNPDGKGLAAVIQTLAVQLCSMETYRVEKSLGEAKTEFRCVSWSPDGKFLAAGTSAGTTVYSAAGKVAREFDEIGSAVAWSRDGKSMVISSSPTAMIKVFDVATGDLVKALSGTAYLVACNGDGKLLVGGDYTNFTTYDVTAGAATHTYEIAGSQTPLWWQGRPIITGVGTAKPSLWDATTGKLQHILEGHGAAVSAVAWSSDGKTLATASYDKTVRIWDPATGKSTFTFSAHTGSVLALAFAHDNKSIASGGSDKKVLVWKVADGTIQNTFEGHSAEVTCVAWGSTASGLLASGSNDKTVRLWNTRTNQPGKEFADAGETGILALAWSPDGKILATGHDDHRVRLWQVHSGKQLNSLEDPGSPPQVTSLAWASNDAAIASGRGNHTMQLWSPKTGQKLLSLLTMAPVVRVGFSTGLGTVVACTTDRTARFFDTATGQLRGSVIAEDGQLALVGADGHYRADNAARDLVFVVQFEKSQETFAPAAFASKFKWQNVPSAIRLAPK